MTHDLVVRVRTFIAQHDLLPEGARVVVGVSGGLDSLVLLHVLVQLREDVNLMLHIATLDHGLRGDAGAADVAFVQQTAEAWDVPVTAGEADVRAYADTHRLGIEAAAREVRYAFLASVARDVGAGHIAVAHIRDDQAETVLLHLLRGSGLKGLRGMLPDLPLSPQPPFPVDGERGSQTRDPITSDAGQIDAPLTLIRPLLDMAREDLEAYAAAHGLQPREDATNEDTAFLRNRVRHEVIPLLETINPQVREALVRLGDVLRVDYDLLVTVGEAAVTRVLRAIRADVAVLSRTAWRDLHPAEKRYVLRHVLERLRGDLEGITFAHITDAIRVADAGQVGAQAPLPGDLTLRVDYDAFVIAHSEADAAEVAGINAPALARVTGPLFFAAHHLVHDVDGWVFEAHPLGADDDLGAIHDDPLAAALMVAQNARLQLRRRAAGDRFRPRGMGGRSQKLSDTLVNMRVPAAWRDRVPLLMVDDEIAWFVVPTGEGLRGRVAEPFAVPEDGAAQGTLIVVVRWRRA